MDLYILRKCSATNGLITAKEHASVQINVGHLDENGIYTGQFITFALCGFIRAHGDADNGMVQGESGGARVRDGGGVGEDAALGFAGEEAVLGETTCIWVSIDVPSAQPPGQYEGELVFIAMKADAECTTQCLGKGEKHQLYRELRNCFEILEPVDGKPMDEVVERVKSATTSLGRVLQSPSFSDFFSDNGLVDMMDEDAISNLAIRLKLTLTVWDFVLPATPSLPAVIGISDTVIEDRFGVEHGSNEWYEALDQHFKWLLQYRISPYFCRWGDSMRVLTYTSPWPADHPKSDEYFSDPRLAAYAVPYSRVISWYAVRCLHSFLQVPSMMYTDELMSI
ncbi:hypothetical protein U1Q18_048486 [Sarracenia purpurea var. burkii]